MHALGSARRKHRWLYWVLLGVCLTGGWIVLLWPNFAPAPDLARPPEESRRVRHPARFSIAVPRKMKARLAPGYEGDPDTSIQLSPDGGRSRYTPVVCVRRLTAEATTVPGWTDRLPSPGVFQGQAAMIFEGTSGEYYVWSAAFDRGGYRYEVSLHLPSFGDVINPMPPPRWVPYLESFRVEVDHP